MKLFLFNNDEKLIGTTSPLEAYQKEELNSIQTLEAIVKYSEIIENAVYIGHKDYDKADVFHLYKIDTVTKHEINNVKITSVNSFFDDMESDGYIKDYRPVNKGLLGVISTILDGSRWQVGTCNVQRIIRNNFYYTTRKAAISKLIEITQIEVKPRFVFSRGRIVGRYLDIFSRLGRDNGKVFVHGRDLLTVSEKQSKGAIYTAVVGRGKGEEIRDDEGQATGGYGRRITFKDVVWTKRAGKPVDKPAGQEYVEIPAMTQLYGFSNGTKPRFKIVEFQDEEDPEKLLLLSYQWLEKNSRVQVEYSATVLNVGNLDLGDTVGISNTKLGIKYKTRVFKVERNLIDNKLTKFGIGDKVTTSPFSRTIELAKDVKNFQDDTIYWLDKIRERLSDKFINEDGYNYDLKANNEYKLPAGYYSFDKPIDQNPTKVVYMGAGKIAIANSKKPNGEWNWKTFLDGEGATLDLINTGILKAGRIQSADGTSYWDLDTGEFHLTQKSIEESIVATVNAKKDEIVEEIKKDIKVKDGVSSYIHKKYSNNSDGRGMNDNSNSSYIGIYTGTSKTAPTDYTQYSWTKIKGEDGRKGEDGKIPNFNLLINSEINDENSFKTNGGNFKLNKGDYNGKNSIEIINNNFTSPAFLGVYFRSSKTSFKKGDKAVLRLPMYIYSDIPVDNGMFIIIKDEKTGTVPYVRTITNRDPRDKWFVIEEKLEALRDFNSTDDYIFKVYTNNNGHFKIAEPYFALGEEVPREWMPSLEDLKAHSLTANVRINGSYEGAKSSGVKFFVDVFYDGKKVTDGFKLTAKVQGAGLNKVQENATYNSTGELTNVYYSDGDKDGTPITIQLDVEYNYIKTTCFARLDNLPSPELVKEVVSKYKTFDSTLEQFKSEIGEITNKQFKVAVRNKQLANLPSLRTGNSLYFYTSENMEKEKVYTFIADIRKFPENQSARITSDINTSNQKLRYGWNFFVFQARESAKAISLYPLGEGTEVKDVEVWEGNFNHMLGEDVFDGVVGSLSSMLSIQTKNTYSEGRFYKIVFDLAIPIQGAMSINAIDYVGGNVPRNAYYPLTTKDNVQYAKVDSKSNTNKDIIRLEFTQNVSPSAITNVRVYEIQLGIRYADKNEIVNISSLIDQAKDEIALSVKETYMSKAQTEATLKVMKDKVETAVTDKEFGTKLIQNAYALRLAWNGISDYVQFENGGMSFYNESIAKSKLRARIDGGNYQFWRDGYTLGDMGTGVFIGDANKRGIQFHLEYDGWFMGWSYKEKRTDDSYTWKWVYTSGNFGPYKTDTLNAGCDINCQWNQLYYFETRSDWLRVKDGISDTIRVKGADDSIYTLKIRNGLLVR